MFRVRLPYSGIAALGCFALFRSAWISMVTGIVVELLIAFVVLKKLTSENEFDYDSLIGQLLLQYTMGSEVEILSLLNLIGARIVSYIVIILIGVLEVSVWWAVLPIGLYLTTIIHYLSPNKQSFL